MTASSDEAALSFAIAGVDDLSRRSGALFETAA